MLILESFYTKTAICLLCSNVLKQTGAFLLYDYKVSTDKLILKVVSEISLRKGVGGSLQVTVAY